MGRRTVVLVNPRMVAPRNARLPLSVLSLAAVLEPAYDYVIVDGHVDPSAADSVRRVVGERDCALVAITVMPGPQVAPAIEIASAVRGAHPAVPIAWGGFFPTLYPDSAINAPYVDYVVRGQGEETLLELLGALAEVGPPRDTHAADRVRSAEFTDGLHAIRGLTWKDDGRIVHNDARPFRPPDDYPPLPYDRLVGVDNYFTPSFMGTRTAVHQAAIGCRYRCSFCGVVSMFDGTTILQGAERLRLALTTLREDYGANAMQFYDHNFFDTEENSLPILEVMEEARLPWWCYARTDTLAGFATTTWEAIRRSGLKMTYVGAEAGSDAALKRMNKGTRVEQTFEVAARCREYGVIPEFSFVLGGPEDPEHEIEATFAFIKRLKRIHPTCEVILYFYSPTPQRSGHAVRAATDATRIPVLDGYGPEGPGLPTTPEEWTERRWIDYVCHEDAPWLSAKTRRRVQDFRTVLYCRFPTVQDYTTPAWGKRTLRALSAWRYAFERYGNPWELDLARKAIPLRQPQREGI